MSREWMQLRSDLCLVEPSGQPPAWSNHGQTMVDHMVDHSGPNLIRDNGSPPCSSSSSFSSPSYPHSSASLISSTFHVAIDCSPNKELTCGPYIAKALIPNCTTALEMEV